MIKYISNIIIALLICFVLCFFTDVTEPLLVEVDQIYHLACPASPIFYKYNPVKVCYIDLFYFIQHYLYEQAAGVLTIFCLPCQFSAELPPHLLFPAVCISRKSHMLFTWSVNMLNLFLHLSAFPPLYSFANSHRPALNPLSWFGRFSPKLLLQKQETSVLSYQTSFGHLLIRISISIRLASKSH